MRHSRYTDLSSILAGLCYAEPGEEETPAAGGEQPAPEVPAAEGAEGEVKAVEQPAPEEPKRKAWWQDRIDGLTRDKYQLRADLDRERQERVALEALLPKPAQPTGTQPNAAPAPVQPAPAGQETDVERRANAIVAEREFTARSNEIYEAGVKAFGDKFDAAVSNLNQAGVMSPAFVEAAMQTEAPERVLHELGAKPEEAMRIAQMPPIRMGIELDRLARTLAAPPNARVSGAPAPITPLTGASKAPIDLTDPALDTKAWMAERTKQIAARQNGGARR